MKPLVTSLCALTISAAIACVAPAEDRTPPTVTVAKVLVLTGNEYPGHHWKETAPLLAKFLAEDARLRTSVVDDPAFLASPKLAEYDTIVLNYMNWKSPDPGDAGRTGLQKFVEGGKGLVLVHFACGAFQDWPEFVKVAGRVWDPKRRGHDPRGPFRVEIKDVNHPITRGLAAFDTDDELYTCLVGDTPIQILATAMSKLDHKEYPMAFVLPYGKGRVFHCVLGHDAKALSFPAVQDLYRRGAAWTAGLPPQQVSEKAPAQ